MSLETINKDIAAILEKAETGAALTREEIVPLLRAEGTDHDALLRTADRVRAAVVGDEVHLRGLIEISNVCVRDCLYCGLRNSNTALKRYRMTPGEYLDTARWAAARGRGTVVIQAGEDPKLSADHVAVIVREIKRYDVAVTLSLGEYSREDYVKMRAAGADRYLLRHETIDRELYQRFHPDMKYENRVRCLQALKEIGFQTGAGMMVGLPGQTIESLADDIFFLRELNVEMAGIGPFIPNPDTPLGGAPAGGLDLVLRCLAVTRLVIPDVLLPATTATGSVHAEGRRQALCAGANVIMPNITPVKYRELYQIYPGKICIAESRDDCASCVEDIVAGLGRRVAAGPGHSPLLAKNI